MKECACLKLLSMILPGEGVSGRRALPKHCLDPWELSGRGDHIVDVEMWTIEPASEQFCERHTIAFMVTDSCEGDSARGEWAGPFPGAVRPLLNWEPCLTPEGTSMRG